MAEKKPIDWEAIETDYRANIKSLRIIASEHGCTEGAIRKRAKKYEWERDLSAKIKAKAAELVHKEEVRRVVRTETPTEKQQIDIGAENQKDLILSHRKDVCRARKLAMSLLDELEEVTDNRDLYEKLGELLEDPDDNGKDKRNEIYMKVISLAGRTGTMKQLSETLKNLVALEREAFGIESKGPLDGLTDAVKNIGISFISAPNRAIA